MNTREIQLRQLGFERNNHQYCFHKYVYDVSWYVDFSDIFEPIDYDWECYLENLKFELEQAKNQYYKEIKESNAYSFAQKEFKKKLKDNYNHYNSKLHQLSVPKMGRTVYQLEELKLSSKIELLKELMNEST